MNKAIVAQETSLCSVSLPFFIKQMMNPTHLFIVFKAPFMQINGCQEANWKSGDIGLVEDIKNKVHTNQLLGGLQRVFHFANKPTFEHDGPRPIEQLIIIALHPQVPHVLFDSLIQALVINFKFFNWDIVNEELFSQVQLDSIPIGMKHKVCPKSGIKDAKIGVAHVGFGEPTNQSGCDVVCGRKTNAQSHFGLSRVLNSFFKSTQVFAA